jgi:hypothetical protein
VTGFQPRTEILPQPQREIWPFLAPTVKLGFVLYGGTAVALRLGHRSSLDFDFFTEHAIDPTELGQHFEFLPRSKVIQQQKNTLTVLAPAKSGDVKISFFGEIGIGRFGIPELTHDGVVRVASLLDLLATKLKVILQRIEAKDYQDIAAILRSGERLEDGLEGATALYSSSFQPSEAVKALTYFEGGDLETLSSGDREYLIRAVTNAQNKPAGGTKYGSLS